MSTSLRRHGALTQLIEVKVTEELQALGWYDALFERAKTESIGRSHLIPRDVSMKFNMTTTDAAQKTNAIQPEIFGNFTSVISVLVLSIGDARVRFALWLTIISVVYFHFLVTPYVVGEIVDLFANGRLESFVPIYQYVLLIGVLWIVASLLRLHAKSVLFRISVDAGTRARLRGFDRLMAQTLRWHEGEQAGSKLQRVQNGSTAVQEILTTFSNDILPLVCCFVGVIGALAFHTLLLGAFTAAYLASFMGLQILFLRRTQQLILESKMAMEAASGSFVEGTSSVLTIKSLGIQQHVRGGVATRERKSRDLKIKVGDLVFLKWRCFQVLNGICIALFVLLVSSYAQEGTITAGAIVMLFTYFKQLSDAAGDSASLIEKMLEHLTTVARMAPLFDERSDPHRGSAAFPSAWKAIELQNVSVAHPGGSGGIFEVTASIRRTEKVGIVGRSGAGKSTLAKLLIGVYAPDRGTYSIGGIHFADLSGDAIGGALSIVLQEAELFQQSLRENISMGRELEPDILLRALRVAQLEELVERLPEGLETEIGERGVRLSGGERQRVSIARAICRAPQILILDESTSALDPITETRLLEALAREFPEVTLLFMTHRISSLYAVERVMVFDSGRLVEQGSPTELDAGGGFFATILEAQKREQLEASHTESFRGANLHDEGQEQ